MKSRLQGKNPEVLRGSEVRQAKQGKVRWRTHNALFDAKLIGALEGNKTRTFGIILPTRRFICTPSGQSQTRPCRISLGPSQQNAIALGWVCSAGLPVMPKQHVLVWFTLSKRWTPFLNIRHKSTYWQQRLSSFQVEFALNINLLFTISCVCFQSGVKRSHKQTVALQHCSVIKRENKCNPVRILTLMGTITFYKQFIFLK